MTLELKPCPFCGGKVKLEEVKMRSGTWYGVKCRNTRNLGGDCTMEQVPSRTPEAAAGRWNMRKPMDELEAENYALQDQIKGLQELMAEQHQGEPVAWVRFRNGEPDYDGDAVMIMNVPGDTLGDGDSWEPVYTHADPGEVERLRASEDKWYQDSVNLTVARDALRSFANEIISAAYEGGSFEGGDIQDMAVKHGLLRIESRAEECGEPCACREYGFPAECYRKTALISTSAEPSAPVEIDERAVFDPIEWLETEISAVDTWYRGSPSYERDAGWMKDQALRLVSEARAVLERKP